MTASVWDEALAVKCRYCGAEPDQPCVNAVTGQPSRWRDGRARHQFVHPCRMVDAEAADPMGLSWPEQEPDPEPVSHLRVVPDHDPEATREFSEPLWHDDE